MFLNYNGVTLELETVTQFYQRPIYTDDETDLLYTEVTISVVGIWNPATAGSPAAGGSGFKNAAKSVGDLRRFLMEPRGVLEFQIPDSSGATDGIVVSSPQFRPGGDTRYDADAANGPFPLSFDVVGFVGEKTAIVSFSIKTYINETPNARACIANRWAMSTDYDDCFFATRTTQGEATFRSDLLADQFDPIQPDDFRISVVPRPPWGFKRIRSQFTQSSDGLSLQYTVVDQQQPTQITDPVIAKIEGYFDDTYAPSGASLTGAVGSAFQGAELGAAGGPWGAAAGAIGGAVVGGFGLIPKRTVTIDITVYGRPIARRADLMLAMSRIVAAFGFDAPAGADARTASTLVFAIRNAFIQTSKVSFDLYERKARMVLIAEMSGATNTGLTLLGFSQGGLSAAAGAITSAVPGSAAAIQAAISAVPGAGALGIAARLPSLSIAGAYAFGDDVGVGGKYELRRITPYGGSPASDGQAVPNMLASRDTREPMHKAEMYTAPFKESSEAVQNNEAPASTPDDDPRWSNAPQRPEQEA